MYNTDLAKDVTLENILKTTSEYDIFRYYIGHSFNINRIFKSPFRKDENPSFGIFKSSKTGNLLYKDLATGDCGNCVKLVQSLLSLSYNEALIKIDEDLNGHKIVKFSKQGVEIQNKKVSSAEILTKTKYFSKQDDLYWEQFGITRDTLKLFNVFPIEYFWANDKLLPFRYTKSEPMYEYQVFNKSKIYRPLSNKKEKWFGNTGIYDIQGYEQLPDKTDLLIITKALKDVMTLYELGYSAIAPNSESCSIPSKVLDKILKDKEVKTVVIFYDNDEAGIKSAEKLSAKYNIQSIQIEDTYEVKDISDFVKKYGITQANQWILKKVESLTPTKSNTI